MSLCFISASHPNLQYVADFAPELGMIINETKYLEQLGFQVPELARNVALQVGCQLNKFLFCLFLNNTFLPQLLPQCLKPF